MPVDMTSRIVQRDTIFVEYVNPGTAIDLNTGDPIAALTFVDDRDQGVTISCSLAAFMSLYGRMGLMVESFQRHEAARGG